MAIAGKLAFWAGARKLPALDGRASGRNNGGVTEIPSPRTGRTAAIAVAVLIAGSGAGVVGWYLRANREGPPLDASGFDLGAEPAARRPFPASAAAPGPAPASSLGMIKADAGIRVAGPGAAAPAGAAAGQRRPSARLSFIEAARRHEAAVRRFGERMTAKHPAIQQYGQDWMSYPDLRKLNNDYWRDRDPVRFLIGLSKSRNFGKLVVKYARSPAIREFIVEGVKQAPAELSAAAMDFLRDEAAVRTLVSNAVQSAGLPPGIAAMVGAGDAKNIDQGKVMAEMMRDPQLRQAMQQGGPPPVLLGSGQ